MKSENTDDNSNKKRGSRLRECREYRNLTQEALSELVNVSTNYVSMLERGERPIDWDKAVKFSEALNVSPAFIMCETDIISIGSRQTTLDLDTFGVSDLLFVKFLIAAGHDIIFHVVNLYDGKQPSKMEALGRTWDNWRSLHIDTTLDNLREFCLSDAHCKLQAGETLSEVIIHEVTLDGHTMTFGRFVYTVNRLYDYIHFTLESIKSFEDDYTSQDIEDKLIFEEIQTSRRERNGIKPSREEILQEAISEIEKQYDVGSVKICSNDEIAKIERDRHKDKE